MRSKISDEQKEFFESYKAKGYKKYQINFLWHSRLEFAPLEIFENPGYTLGQLKVLFWGFKMRIPTSVIYKVAHPIYTMARMRETLTDWLAENRSEDVPKSKKIGRIPKGYKIPKLR